MSLTAQVTGRYSEEYLAQLTNPDDRAATSYDATRLGYAVADAAAEFARVTATTYDDTNADHVGVCVDLVIVLLMERKGMGVKATEDMRRGVTMKLESLAKNAGRERPGAYSSGDGLQSTVEAPSGSRTYHRFDRRNLEGFLPSTRP